MRRMAKAGEFRSNLHRGGLGIKVKLDRRYRSAAVARRGSMGLEVAGVDMLEGTQRAEDPGDQQLPGARRDRARERRRRGQRHRASRRAVRLAAQGHAQTSM